ncbi:MAG: OmpA family protein [Proteobacteria bacterium]|nr:OmpA family protein [Pseudomonadota bacterium]
MKFGPYKYARQALPLVFVFTLASCTFFDDVVDAISGDEPATQTASDEGVRARGDSAREAANDSDTPSLTTVPDRPQTAAPTNRERVVEGLISDRENARYTDEAIRLQGSTRAPDASQSASRAVTPPPAVVAAPAPAPASATPTVIPPPPPVIPAPQATVPAPPTVTARPSLPPAPVVQPVIQPRPATPSLAANAPAASVQQASGSVTVDMSAIGGGYVPATASAGQGIQVATIQFNHSSSNLSARDRQIIATVASAQRSDNSDVRIVGHASSRTMQLPKARHEVANFQVSFKRANAVAQALIESGVPSNRVTVEAVSDDQPIYSEAMPTGEAGNRRTEIYFRR